MWKTVERYSLGWRTKSKAGIIYLKFSDGTFANIQPHSVQEVAALGDILRNEQPVYYHTVSGDLATGWDPIGEEERGITI